MRMSGIYFAGIGVADVGGVDTEYAVNQGWYGAEDRERGQLLSVSVAGTKPAPDLAVEAARKALDQSRCSPDEFCAVFHTNVHPQGPDGWSAQHYINRNTINQPVTSVEIHNGCIGFFSALQLAACYLNAVPDRTAALVTCADNFGTPAVDRWRSTGLFVLGDGGGGVVVSKRGGFAKLLAIGSISHPELEAHHRGGEPLFPPGITNGGLLNFGERMAYSHRRAEEGRLPPMGDFGSVLVETVTETLKDAGVTMGEIARVVHDGFTHDALRVIFLDPLEIDDERGIWEYTRQVGHAGPLDQIRGLEYLWKNRLVGPGDRVLLLSGAPGMEAACAVLEITDERE
jgi:3-oxoacyl-[acyl-carrier-protein] synthase-3